MAILQGGGGGPGGFGEVGLRQVGWVPSEARSFRFKTLVNTVDGGTLVVRLSGRQLALIPVETQTNFTSFAADIGFASGTVSELSLAVLVDFSRGISGGASVDDLQFSPLPAIPPSNPPSISMEPVAYVSPSSGYDPDRYWIRFNGVLQISEAVDGPFTDYPGAVSPYRAAISGNRRFYRVIAYPDPSARPVDGTESE